MNVLTGTMAAGREAGRAWAGKTATRGQLNRLKRAARGEGILYATWKNPAEYVRSVHADNSMGQLVLGNILGRDVGFDDAEEFWGAIAPNYAETIMAGGDESDAFLQGFMEAAIGLVI